MRVVGLNNESEFLMKNEKLKGVLTYFNLERIMKKKPIKLSRTEIYRLVYNTLLEFPEGLTRREIIFFTGLPLSTIRRTLRGIQTFIKTHRNKIIYERKLDHTCSVYYAGKHARKTIKYVNKTKQMIKELEKKCLELMK